MDPYGNMNFKWIIGPKFNNQQSKTALDAIAHADVLRSANCQQVLMTLHLQTSPCIL